MSEIVTTRHNPMIDPSLHIWGWEIAVYLFLGGLVAGLMILSGYHIVRDQWDKDRPHGHYVTAPLLSIVLLSLGMLALFFDLEHKLYVWRLYLTFAVKSPMSWGSWILLLVYPALLASALLTFSEAMPFLAGKVPWLRQVSGELRSRPAWAGGIGFANMALGVLLGIYTGILLSAMGARPLWNSGLLGPLFLFSGLSSGAAALHLLAHRSHRNGGETNFNDAILSSLVQWLRPVSASAEGARKLVQADNSFLTVELAILLLFIVGLLSSTQTHQQAVQMLLTGSYAAVFWVFVVGLGILMPLTLQWLQTLNKIRPTLLPAVLVICGSLALRFIMVYAGQASHWHQIAAQGAGLQ
jgi:formate-dependent nitrite reductase membrane component NrfD